ncbi:uncharacterized protein LOC116123781 [Pistacia vera]|uniref:uncharacterized protein LOC116123781 n=1 Tax=Pistacia vera TaxID=55513 RepID=UPI001262D79C|nr:uncharacterized protein LOC116123781 [Pistacia vera]
MLELDSCAPCATHFGSSKSSLSTDDGLFQDITLYRSMVGGLQYLTLTRPDIAFAVNQVTQRWSAPTHRYLKGILLCGLTFHRDLGLHLLAYSNADGRLMSPPVALSLAIVFFLVAI